MARIRLATPARLGVVSVRARKVVCFVRCEKCLQRSRLIGIDAVPRNAAEPLPQALSIGAHSRNRRVSPLRYTPGLRTGPPGGRHPDDPRDRLPALTACMRSAMEGEARWLDTRDQSCLLVQAAELGEPELARAADGLEPSTPSLPFRCARNYRQSKATVSACLSRFRGWPIRSGLRPFAPALLHKCSIHAP